MRKQIECALLALEQASWLASCQGSHLGGRLVLSPLESKTASSSHHAQAQALLLHPGLVHGRYDAALIHVDESSLGVWRTMLSNQVQRLPALIFVYASDLRAQAIRDLLQAGVSDFVRPPFCPEELRARLEASLNRLRPLGVAEDEPLYGVPRTEINPLGTRAGDASVESGTEAHLCATILERSGTELEAYAVALAMQRATSQESFRAAKGRVIARFERAYICAALGRHQGNVTRAAQMAQKHRRAFWALMRKHQIDPAPYRNGG